MQDGFDWSAVATSAIGAGVTSGLGGSSLWEAVSRGSAVATSDAGNVISQGIGVATGLQESFN